MRKPTFVICAMLSSLTLTADASGATAVALPLQSVEEAIRDHLGLTEYSLQDLELPTDLNGPFFVIATIDGIDFTLALFPHSIRGDGFVLLVQDDSGTLNRVEPPAPRTLRGSVLELPESTVAGSLLEFGLSASIWMADGTAWTIAPLKELVGDARRATHVVYRNIDVSLDEFTCGVDASALPPSPESGEADPAQGGSGGPDGTGLMITDLAIDADWHFYGLNGSSFAATLVDVERVMDRVNIVYERDVEVTFELTTVVIRTSQAQNPYTSNNNNTLLAQFQSHWSTTHSDIQRDVAHLMTGRNINGGIIGTANGIGNMCNNTYSFAQSRFTGSINGRVALTAHEIGHNYNGFHCNQVSPPQVPCNIMCSGLGGCNGVGLPNFGPWNINRIVLHRNSRNCLVELRPARPIPFGVEFITRNLNRERFSYAKGTVINDEALNEPSASFSIELNTAVNGHVYDDDLRTVHILLGGETGAILRYWTQHRGVEAGESLVVQYRSNNLAWVELNRIVSDGINQTEFDFHQHGLPNNAFHDKFRIRWFTEVDERNDDFFIDSIRLADDPAFVVSIQSVGVTDVPIEVWPAALFGQTNGITPFTRRHVLDAPLRLTAPAAHQGEPFTEWRIDGSHAVFNLTLETTVTSAFTAEAVYGESCDPCDMNCDGDVNAFDIEPFLDLLFGPNPDPCDTCTGDVNGDGTIDAFDIEPFLNCLFP